MPLSRGANVVAYRRPSARRPCAGRLKRPTYWFALFGLPDAKAFVIVSVFIDLSFDLSLENLHAPTFRHHREVWRRNFAIQGEPNALAQRIATLHR